MPTSTWPLIFFKLHEMPLVFNIRESDIYRLSWKEDDDNMYRILRFRMPSIITFLIPPPPQHGSIFATMNRDNLLFVFFDCISEIISFLMHFHAFDFRRYSYIFI